MRIVRYTKAVIPLCIYLPTWFGSQFFFSLSFATGLNGMYATLNTHTRILIDASHEFKIPFVCLPTGRGIYHEVFQQSWYWRSIFHFCSNFHSVVFRIVFYFRNSKCITKFSIGLNALLYALISWKLKTIKSISSWSPFQIHLMFTDRGRALIWTLVPSYLSSLEWHKLTKSIRIMYAEGEQKTTTNYLLT